MNSIKKTARFADISQSQAVTTLRILYPIWAIIGMFSLGYVSSTLIVAGDAAATANNIMANELLFSMGIIGSLVTQLIHIVVVLVLYKLFKSVNKNMALLLVILGLVGIPIAMLNELNQVAALLLTSGADYLSIFSIDQLHALTMFFLNLNAEGIIIDWLFWGLWLFPLGYLIYKSGYFPKILGVFMVLAGFGYFLGTFAHFLLPNFAALSLIFEIIVYGELLFMIWVLFMGAKLPEMKS